DDQGREAVSGGLPLHPFDEAKDLVIELNLSGALGLGKSRRCGREGPGDQEDREEVPERASSGRVRLYQASHYSRGTLLACRLSSEEKPATTPQSAWSRDSRGDPNHFFHGA